MNEPTELDPEIHEGDTVVSVWKRRFILGFLIVLVIAVAAPSFSGCSGFFAEKKTAATFDVAGKTYTVTDEDLSRFRSHYSSAMRLLRFSPGFADGEDGVNEALRKLMLDAEAKAAGVRVADAKIAEIIRSLPQFQVGGQYDESRYRAELSNFSRAGLTHEGVCEMLRTEIRTEEFEGIKNCWWQVIPGDSAYEQWKKTNLKLTVDYVASPFAAQRARIEAMEPTPEQLNSIANLPEVKSLLAVPPRKTIEVAYMKAKDLSAEEYAAGQKFAEEAELVTEDRTLEADAFVMFHGKRDSIFTKEAWGRITDPEYAKHRREYEEDHAKWEKEPADGRRPEPTAPKDPTADYPAEENLQFLVWRDRAMRETLAEKITGKLAVDAQKEGRSLTEAGAAYARFGLKVVKNAEPLTDADIVDKFPDPVARDSEFDQVARTVFKAPAEGVVFKPQYQTQPVPTTRVADRLDDRGYMVMRLDGCDPARQYTFAEKPEVARTFWRKHQVAEAARALAQSIQAKAEAAGPDVPKIQEALRAAAAEAGLTVQTLRRFNRGTEAPKVPAPAPGQTLTPEVEAAAARIKFRNLVQQEYPLLASYAPGKFCDPVFMDDKSEAAYSMLVVEKHEPTPVEMRDSDVRQARYGVAFQAKAKADELFSYESVAKRLNLARFDEKSKKPEMAENSQTAPKKK